MRSQFLHELRAIWFDTMGGHLPSTIKITGPKIDDFNIWAGPAVNSVGLEQSGRIHHPLESWSGRTTTICGLNKILPSSVLRRWRTITDDPKCLAEKPHLA